MQVNLSYAYSPFLYVLAQGWLGMESPKSLAADTPAQLCQHPVGSGPFVLTNYTENVGVTYVARKGYDWGPPNWGSPAALTWPASTCPGSARTRSVTTHW